jgi:ketosteroid isomerase-like protein
MIIGANVMESVGGGYNFCHFLYNDLTFTQKTTKLAGCLKYLAHDLAVRLSDSHRSEPGFQTLSNCRTDWFIYTFTKRLPEKHFIIKLKPMKKPIVLLLAAVCLISCKREKEVIIEKIISTERLDVDSLNRLFVDGWNNSDSAAIMNTFYNDAIVMNDSSIHKGADAIARDWVSGGVKVLSNIETVSLVKGSSATLAYDAGTYSCNLNIPGGPVLIERGNYSMVWEKTPDNGWKLKKVHIEDITQMPDVPR